MTSQVTLPLWAFILILLFAAVTFASHFLFPSVRWFFRRRMERAVKRLNERLERPIQPFKLLRRQDMIQRLVYDPEVTQAIVDHARAEGVRARGRGISELARAGMRARSRRRFLRAGLFRLCHPRGQVPE